MTFMAAQPCCLDTGFSLGLQNHLKNMERDEDGKLVAAKLNCLLFTVYCILWYTVYCILYCNTYYCITYNTAELPCLHT